MQGVREEIRHTFPEPTFPELLTVLEASGAALGRSRGRLGRVLGRLEGVLGRPGGVLGASWDLPGASWGVLGPSWGLLGPSWGSFFGILIRPRSRNRFGSDFQFIL